MFQLITRLHADGKNGAADKLKLENVEVIKEAIRSTFEEPQASCICSEVE